MSGGAGSSRGDLVGDWDRVIAGGERVVEEQERIAVWVWWHERGPRPGGHVDGGRIGEGQPDRPLVMREAWCLSRVQMVGGERGLDLADDEPGDAGQSVDEDGFAVDREGFLFQLNPAVLGDLCSEGEHAQPSRGGSTGHVAEVVRFASWLTRIA